MSRIAKPHMISFCLSEIVCSNDSFVDLPNTVILAVNESLDSVGTVLACVNEMYIFEDKANSVQITCELDDSNLTATYTGWPDTGCQREWY